MSEELVTIDSITTYLKKAVEEKIQLSPSHWVDASQKLNTLLGDEDDKFYELEQQVNERISSLIEEKNSVAQAEVFVKGTDLYTKMQKQKAKIKRIEGLISIAKKQATLRESEMKGY